MKRALYLLFFVLLLIGCSSTHKHTLSNGMTVITKSLPQANTVAIDALIHDGLADESIPGIRNFVQTLLIKGTTKHNATELALLIDQLGSVGTATYEDYVELQFNIPKDNLPQALDLLAELLQEANFPGAEIEKERVRILEAIKTQEDNPTEALSNALLKQLYAKHPYSVDVLGTSESVKTITRDDLLNYYSQHYAAPVISIVGNIDQNSIIAALNDRLSNLTTAQLSSEKVISPEARRNKKFHKEKAITDNWIGIGYPAPNATDPERFSVVMMNAVLGGSMGARLFTNLRDKQGLAYSVGSRYSALERAGHVVLYMGTHPYNQQKALKGLLVEAKKLEM